MQTSIKKSVVAPIYFRKLIKDHTELNKNKIGFTKKIFVMSLKYIPHSIFKLIENLPFPWQKINFKKILYHISGSICFITEIPYDNYQIYFCKWGMMWEKLQLEKKNRKHFKRIKIPSFDDEEKPIDFLDILINVNSPLNKLTKHESLTRIHTKIFESSFQKIKNFQNKCYKDGPLIFKMLGLKLLEKLSKTILTTVCNKNYYYLFDFDSFLVSKSLGLVIPGGPKFDNNKIFNQTSNKSFSVGSSVNKSILRFPIRTEYKIRYPYLYCSNVLINNDSVQYYYNCKFLKPINYTLPCFIRDPSVNNIKDLQKKKSRNFISLMLSSKFGPTFNKLNIYNKNSIYAIELLWHSFPFDNRILIFRRVIDIDICTNWILEHCPLNYPVKVRISYQKLLKKYLLNKINKKKKSAI